VSDTEEEVQPQVMYRIDEVAEILRVSGETVRTWAKDGKLEGFKDRADVAHITGEPRSIREGVIHMSQEPEYSAATSLLMLIIVCLTLIALAMVIFGLTPVFARNFLCGDAPLGKSRFDPHV